MIRSTEATVCRFYWKWVFLKILQHSKKTSVLESLFNKVSGLQAVTLLKSTSSIGVLCEDCEMFKKPYFEKHLRTAAFDI